MTDPHADESRKKDVKLQPKGSGPEEDRMELDEPEGNTYKSEPTVTKGAFTDSGTKDSKLASDDISLEQIQKDMGEAFLTCRTSMTPFCPQILT